MDLGQKIFTLHLNELTGGQNPIYPDNMREFYQM